MSLDDILTYGGATRRRRWRALTDLGQDLACSARALRRDPAFSALAILIFALGIGATTALFSAYDGLVMRPLAIAEPDRAVWITAVDGDNGDGVSPAAWFAWKERARSLEQLATMRGASKTMQGAGDPARVDGLLVGAGFFETIGSAAAVGRALAPRDYESGAAPVVVLSHALWRRKFGGDSAAVGRTVTLDGTLFTIAGVMPPAADLTGSGMQFWIPEVLTASQRNNFTPYLNAVGRLARGASAATAEGELQTVLASIEADAGRTARPLRAQVTVLGDFITAPFRDRVLLLFVAVLFVLAIGCVNIATLLLARGAGRTRELAVRASLGASRGRLIRQLLTETVLLAALGGAAGLLLAAWLIRGLVAILPRDLPRLAQVSLDTPAVVFALGITLVAALLAGVFPALRAARVDLRSSLQEGGHGATRGAAHDRLRRAFVVTEVVLTVVLLVSSGLLVRSARALGAVAPGFSPDSVLTARYALPRSAYESADAILATHARMLASLREALGPRVALSSKVPLDGNSGGGSDFQRYGAGADGRGDVNAAVRLTTPGYLATMGIALIAGRDFTDADQRSTARAIIVSEGLARRLGLGASAVGSRIAGTSSPFKDSTGTPYPWEVVGVARDPRDWGQRNDAQPQVFIPVTQTPEEMFGWSGREMHLVVRSTGPAEQLRGRLVAAVRQVDPALPLYDLQTMRERLRASVALERANTILVAALGVVALLLAVTGVYGVVSYSVRQREPEIGLRMALGAQRQDILSMVLRWGGSLIVIGLAVGLPLALVAARALRSLLFGVGASDPVTLVGVTLTLGAVAALSCLVPARRAMRMPPDIVLRG